MLLKNIVFGKRVHPDLNQILVCWGVDKVTIFMPKRAKKMKVKGSGNKNTERPSIPNRKIGKKSKKGQRNA